jgi:hypothetical protein
MTTATEPKTPSTLTHLRKKTVLSILRTWRELKGTARNAIGSEVQPSVPKEDISRLRSQMQECLTSRGGEITARAHTVELGRTYLGLTDSGRAKFLRLLAEDFDIDHARLLKRIEAVKGISSRSDSMKLENDLVRRGASGSGRDNLGFARRHTGEAHCL